MGYSNQLSCPLVITTKVTFGNTVFGFQYILQESLYILYLLDFQNNYLVINWCRLAWHFGHEFSHLLFQKPIMMAQITFFAIGQLSTSLLADGVFQILHLVLGLVFLIDGSLFSVNLVFFLCLKLLPFIGPHVRLILKEAQKFIPLPQQVLAVLAFTDIVGPAVHKKHALSDSPWGFY